MSQPSQHPIITVFPIKEGSCEGFNGDSGGEGKRERCSCDSGDPPDSDPEPVEHAAAPAAHDAVGAEEEDAAQRGALADPGGAGGGF